MKKILPLLLLLFVLILPGCGEDRSSSNTCTFSGSTSNTSYLIIIDIGNDLNQEVIRYVRFHRKDYRSVITADCTAVK